MAEDRELTAEEVARLLKNPDMASSPELVDALEQGPFNDVTPTAQVIPLPKKAGKSPRRRTVKGDRLRMVARLHADDLKDTMMLLCSTVSALLDWSADIDPNTARSDQRKRDYYGLLDKVNSKHLLIAGHAIGEFVRVNILGSYDTVRELLFAPVDSPVAIVGRDLIYYRAIKFLYDALIVSHKEFAQTLEDWRPYATPDEVANIIDY